MVSLPLILTSMPGTDKSEFGTIMSFGYLFYAAGKLVSGPLIDTYGGAPLFMAGFFGSLFSTQLFVLAPSGTGTSLSLTMQLLALGSCWSLNRFCQVHQIKFILFRLKYHRAPVGDPW
jgi:MFS family permease